MDFKDLHGFIDVFSHQSEVLVQLVTERRSSQLQLLSVTQLEVAAAQR